MPDLLIRDLPGAVSEGQAFQRVEPDDLFWPEQDAEDEAALKIVNADVARAESFLVSRQYVRQWDQADRLFYAYVAPINWPGTETPRASLGMPLLATHLFSILSMVQQALFSGVKWFQCDPRPGTTLATAEANQALVQWELERSNFKQEFRLLTFDAIDYGTGCGFWGFEPVRKVKRKKVQKKTAPILGESSIEVVEEETTLVLPKFEYVNIRHYLVDPGCRRGDVRTGKWWGRRMYLTADDLDELRDVDGFKNIPTRDQLERLTTPEKEAPYMNPMEMGSFNSTINLGRKALPRWMDTTTDPLKQGFEVFEYWTQDRVIYALEKQLCIRNATHDLGVIPAVSINFHEAPDAYYGIGLAHLVGPFQSVMQGVVNLFLDDMSLNLNGMFVSKKGMNETGQAIWASPGKVVRVDDPAGFKPIDRQPVGGDAMGMIEACSQWAQTASGASEISVQGTMPSNHSSITRTAGGAAMLDQGTRTRGENFIDQCCDLVILPVLMAFMDMNFANLTPAQVKQVLGDELGHAYEDDPLNIQNGSYKISISAGARLQARNALASQLPTIISMITSPTMLQGLQTEAKKINYSGIAEMIFNATGYPGRADVVVPMTQEDQDRMMKMNAAASKLNQQQQKIQQEADAQLEVEEAKTGGRALIQVMKHGMEQDAKSLGTQ